MSYFDDKVLLLHGRIPLSVSRWAGHGVLLGKLLSPDRNAVPRGISRDGWRRNRNDIRSRSYDEDESLRLLARSETADPHGARPNKVYEYLYETWVGCLAESCLKQKEG